MPTSNISNNHYIRKKKAENVVEKSIQESLQPTNTAFAIRCGHHNLKQALEICESLGVGGPPTDLSILEYVLGAFGNWDKGVIKTCMSSTK